MGIKDYKSLTDDYMTPKEIYQPILNFIGKEKFNLDVCTTKLNIPADYHCTESNGIIRVENIYRKEPFPTEDKCGLNANWYGKCFMNPPWAKTEKWVKKAFSEVQKNNCEVWCVLPGDRLNMKYFNSILRENKNWFIAVLEKNKAQKFNFENPYISEEENQENAKNGGFGKPIFIMYIGQHADKYSKRWDVEQPLTSLVMRGV